MLPSRNATLQRIAERQRYYRQRGYYYNHRVVGRGGVFYNNLLKKVKTKRQRQLIAIKSLAVLSVAAFFCAAVAWRPTRFLEKTTTTTTTTEYTSPEVVLKRHYDATQAAAAAAHRSTRPPVHTVITESPAVRIQDALNEKSETSQQQADKEDEESDSQEWLQQYIQFHRNQIVHGPRQRSELVENTRFLQWHCDADSIGTCGGLGDRINGILQAFIMAVCTDRVFLIDWRNRRSSALTEFLQPSLLEWYVDRVPPPNVRIDTMDNRNNTYLQEPLTLPNDTGISIKGNLWMGQEQITNTQCWKRKYSSYSRFPTSSLYQTAFRTLFQWSPAVLESTVDLKRRANLTTTEPYIAMHIRTGLVEDGMLLRHANAMDWSKFEECARRIQRGIQNITSDEGKLLDVYVAADHTSVKETFVRKNKEGQRSSFKSVLDLDIIHLDKSGRRGTGPDSDDMKIDRNSELAVWSELNVLRDAVCLVMSHSKYSNLAAELSPSQCALYFDQCEEDTVAQVLATSRVALDTITSEKRIISS